MFSFRFPAIAVALALAACARTGPEPRPAEVRPPTPLRPLAGEVSLAPKATFTDDDLRHFLARTHFGVQAATLDTVRAQGLPAYVTAMLRLPPHGSTPWEVHARRLLERPDDPPGYAGGYPDRDQLVDWWFELMLRSEQPFQEVVALFWHDHFATSSWALDPIHNYWMVRHVELFRASGLGSARDLLVAVARDWAMLQSLDGITNDRRAPNENFARELFELFALGHDNGYDEADVRAAARACTGYRVRANGGGDNRFHAAFDPALHDPGAKVVLGATIPGQNRTDDFPALVDAVLATGRVAPFVAESLLRWFCRPDPPPRLVANLAAELERNGMQIGPTLGTLFLSEAFHDPGARRCLVAHPIQFMVGFTRATGLVLEPHVLRYHATELGMVPTQPPSVEGWPYGDDWLTVGGTVARADFLLSCVFYRDFQLEQGLDLTTLLPSRRARAGEVVDATAARLRVPLTGGERAEYVRYLNTDRLPNGQVVSDPFDPGDADQLDERLRGLLFALAQHPAASLQ